MLVLDRAGITGDDGPSHHGVLDMALGLSIPGMTVFAPSSAQEVEVMLAEALTLAGPSMIRFPKTPAPSVAPGTQVPVGSGLEARQVRAGDGSVCVLAVGKLVDSGRGGRPDSWPTRASMPRCGTSGWCRDPDPAMLADAAPPRRGGDRRGRRAPGRGRDVPGRRPAGVVPAGRGPPGASPSASPVRYLPQDKPDRILARLGLDADGLARTVRGALGRSPGRWPAGRWPRSQLPNRPP